MTPSMRARTRSSLRLRLEVDVGGALLDRARDDRVDELDRGRARRRRALADVADRRRPRRPSSVLVVDLDLVPVDAVDRAARGRRRRRRPDAMLRPRASRRSSECGRCVGSATATSTTSSPRKRTGSAAYRRANLSGSRPRASGSISALGEVDVLEPVLLGEACASARPETQPRRTTISPSRSPVSSFSASASSSCSVDSSFSRRRSAPSGRRTPGRLSAGMGSGSSAASIAACIGRIVSSHESRCPACDPGPSPASAHEVVGEIGPGLCVLLGVARGDERRRRRAARRKHRAPAHLRERGREVRLQPLDVGGAALVVSQFTLIADTEKGNRPSFSEAAAARGGGAALRALLRGAPRRWASRSRQASSARGCGSSSSNDGPVTIVLD